MRSSFLFSVAVALLSFGGSFGCESGPEPVEETSVVPPSPIEGAPAGDGAGVMLAVTRFRVGTHTLDGNASSEAWQMYGYDLDGLITHDTFDGHCQPASGASEIELEDGEGGVDNAFGKLLVPGLEFLLQAELEDMVNGTLGSGSDGLLIHLRDLGAERAYGDISAFAYGLRTATDGGPWLLSPESVAEPDAGELDDVLQSGLTGFSESYVSDDVWVGRGSDGVVELTWLVGGQPLVLRVHQPLVTVELSEAHDSTTRGVLAGVLDVQETTDTVRDWIDRYSESFCDGSAIEGVLARLAQMADLMNDGSQDPGSACNGISFAVGFDASVVEVSSVAEPRELVAPCVSD